MNAFNEASKIRQYLESLGLKVVKSPYQLGFIVKDFPRERTYITTKHDYRYWRTLSGKWLAEDRELEDLIKKALDLVN